MTASVLVTSQCRSDTEPILDLQVEQKFIITPLAQQMGALHQILLQHKAVEPDFKVGTASCFDACQGQLQFALSYPLGPQLLAVVTLKMACPAPASASTLPCCICNPPAVLGTCSVPLVELMLSRDVAGHGLFRDSQPDSPGIRAVQHSGGEDPRDALP